MLVSYDLYEEIEKACSDNKISIVYRLVTLEGKKFMDITYGSSLLKVILKERGISYED